MKQFYVIFSLFLSGFLCAQQTDYVDFKKIEANLNLLPEKKKVEGMLFVEFKIITNTDSVYLDAKSTILRSEVWKYSKTEKTFSNNQKEKIVRTTIKDGKLWFYDDFKKGKTYRYGLHYEAMPQKTLYFLKHNEDWNIWTQGQGKYTSNWLPSLDDVNDKIEFDLTVTFNKSYSVNANGKLVEKNLSDTNTTWHYDMQKPMSSYLVALTIGKYNKKTETSKSGIPLEYYFYVEDSLNVEPTYRYSKQIFDFLEEEIAIPFPWQNYKQVPVHDFLYAGMENTSLTIFSDAFVVDSIGFNDKNYVSVNAHELAHQWFGDLVTAKSGEHHWLQEGFATYYALLAERHVLGEDEFYFKLYQSAQDLGRQDVAGAGTSLLNPKSSSLTFYQRGAWVLFALRNKVGDKIFKGAVKNYLETYKFSSAETSDFISEVEMLYGRPINDFVEKWILQKAFPFDEAMGILKNKSALIQEYAMIDCEAKTSKCAEQLKYYISDRAKVKIIAQAPNLVTSETFLNSLEVRQAIAKYVVDIPNNIKPEYETLLSDKSYITIESALYNLWLNFPLERSKYLSKTKGVDGFSDRNVRLLWLVLNLNTPEYQADKKDAIYNELLDYTKDKYNADLRINAFQYLDLINGCNEVCQSNLKNAKSHHNWRLVKFARELSQKLNQNKN